MDVVTIARPQDGYLNSLLALDVWAANTLSFAFPAPLDYDGYEAQSPLIATFIAFSAAQKAGVRAVLAHIESFTGLDFTEITGASAGSAVLRFGNTGETDVGFAFLPNADPTGGDSWYPNEADMLAPKRGDYAFFTLLHEIGHALGLSHPHEPEVGDAMPEDRDWMGYTVMSYRSYVGTQREYYTNLDGHFAQTYMPMDIAALQYAYGANFAHNAGNTVYKWNGTTGEMSINGVAQGAPAAEAIFMTLWDGGGIDTLDFTGAIHVNAVIDLRPGAGSSFMHPVLRADLGDGNRAPANIYMPYLYEVDTRSLIENVITGDQSAIVHGNSAANRLELGGKGGQLFGYDGNDLLFINGDGGGTIDGGNGNDQLRGGGYLDELIGGDGLDSLWGAMGGDTLNGGAGDDLLYGEGDGDRLNGGDGIDQLFGGVGYDFLYGDAGNDVLHGGDDIDRLFGGDGDDTLNGGDGNDTFEGGAGADRMDGGLGDDTYFWNDAADIIVELADGGAQDMVWSHFSVTAAMNLEYVILQGTASLNATGGSGADRLIGNSGNNVLDGGGGDDFLRGTTGDDTYYVDSALDDVFEELRGGYDTVYASASYVIAMGVWTTRWNGFDIERWQQPGAQIELLVLTGTADIDGSGNEAANALVGNSGRNKLNGFDGADRLTGGLGNDTIDGGGHVDTAVVSGLRSSYTVNQTATGTFRVVGADGVDTLTNTEYLQFDDQLLRLLPGTGVAVDFGGAQASYNPSLAAIRDFDGNDLGGVGDWQAIGAGDVNGDGDADQILVNKAIGRFATVAIAADGLVYFADHGWAGETRIAGIYIDPLVQSREVVAGSDEDSQRRFQNDLSIDNIDRVLGAADYDGDGLSELYFALADSTAYLHAYMHADGNIRYANYQSEAQVIAYLTGNGVSPAEYADWFG